MHCAPYWFQLSHGIMDEKNILLYATKNLKSFWLYSRNIISTSFSELNFDFILEILRLSTGNVVTFEIEFWLYFQKWIKETPFILEVFWVFEILQCKTPQKSRSTTQHVFFPSLHLALKGYSSILITYESNSIIMSTLYKITYKLLSNGFQCWLSKG